MPNPTQISLLDYHFETKACNALLTAMLNHSDIDYATVSELRDFNKLSCFTDDELHAALHELCKRGFLLLVEKTYGNVYSEFYSKNFDDFLQRCNECGIEYVYKPQNKVKLKFRLKDEGQQKFTRADTFGEEYTAERIAEQIEQIQQGRAILDRLAEKKKHESVATSIATVTAPIKSNAVEPVSMPEQTEHIVSETNDVWAEIRDMRGSATMIADLEANGISSLDELKSFFWNTHHDDDHTKELDAIEKKINDVEKLIKKAQHCDELYPIYKEHKKLTGLKEKFYKKKHVNELDDFHKTYNYISKAVKKYDLPGKADRTLELQCLSLKLKEEYNALVPEHNAFLRKQAAASQYSRQVRNYLDTKKQQERNRQYQERKRSQQKKKDYLE